MPEDIIAIATGDIVWAEVVIDGGTLKTQLQLGFAYY